MFIFFKKYYQIKIEKKIDLKRLKKNSISKLRVVKNMFGILNNNNMIFFLSKFNQNISFLKSVYYLKINKN